MSVTCPRCWFEFDNPNENEPGQYFHTEVPDFDLAPAVGDFYEVSGCRCPACRQFIVWAQVPDGQLIYPRVDLRKHVPDAFHKGFREACRILKESPNSSAAASRRCLQLLIRTHFKIVDESGKLNNEIKSLVARNQLPLSLAADLKVIQRLGNHGAHPSPSLNPGEDVEVEPGEAHWLIDILVRLSDFLFVAPERSKRRREEFNSKLVRAGLRPLDFPASDETVH